MGEASAVGTAGAARVAGGNMTKPNNITKPNQKRTFSRMAHTSASPPCRNHSYPEAATRRSHTAKAAFLPKVKTFFSRCCCRHPPFNNILFSLLL